MKKLFLVLGVFALFFGLSSFTTVKESDNTKKSGHFGHYASDGMCDPGGSKCSYGQLDTVEIK